MLLIILCVVFSVAVSMVIRMTSRHSQLNLRQMIAFNYITAIIFCYLLLRPTIAQATIHAVNFFLFLALGILLPSIFIVMGYAIQSIGIIRTDIAQRLALFVPILASFTLFHEAVTPFKMIGIILAFLAILCLLSGEKIAPKTPTNVGNPVKSKPAKSLLYFLGVLIGFGAIDILFKQVASSKTDFGFTLLLVFTLAAIILFSITLFKREPIHKNNIMIGSLIGLLNFANIYFYLRAHQFYAKDPTLVFTGVNVGVIILATLLGKIFFKEPINRLNWLGIFSAILAIVLLFNGQQLINILT